MKTDTDNSADDSDSGNAKDKSIEHFDEEVNKNVSDITSGKETEVQAAKTVDCDEDALDNAAVDGSSDTTDNENVKQADIKKSHVRNVFENIFNQI